MATFETAGKADSVLATSSKRKDVLISKQVSTLRFSLIGPIALLMVSSVSSFSSTPLAASGINTCKYLAVADFTSDPFGIAKELREQARTRGFIVVSSPSEAPSSELLNVCLMAGSWTRTGSGGSVAVQVKDAFDGDLIGEAAASGTAWWSASRTVRGVVNKLYNQLGYTGFSEAVFRDRVQRLYPPLPKLPVSEAQITDKQPSAPIEGIWNDPKNEYRLGIVKARDGINADYVAVVLESASPVWQPGEIKAEIRATASPDVFTCTWFMGNKKPSGITLSLVQDSVLRGSIDTPKGPHELEYLRVWPKTQGLPAKATSQEAGKSGTGFLLTRSGLIATNWHVVSGTKRVAVTFPGWTESANADLVVRDVINDLAILRINDAEKLANVCPEMPFQLAPAKNAVLGEQVSTIGYPLSSLLGSNPKFSEGVIAAKSGIQDDPRWFQISAAIQPGSSGSPLFDSEGNVVGIVVASLDAAKAFQMTQAIPQNVNWAIKSDYLLSLAEMIPDAKLVPRMVTFSPEKAAACIALIAAW